MLKNMAFLLPLYREPILGKGARPDQASRRPLLHWYLGGQ